MVERVLSDSVEGIKDFIRNQIIPDYKLFHNKNVQFIESYTKSYENWQKLITEKKEKLELFSITAELHRKLEENLHIEKEILSNTILFEQYQNLKKKLEESLEKIDPNIVLNQEKSHFNSLEQDSKKIHFLKTIKRSTYSISAFFFHIIEGKEKEYIWTRKIPLKNLATHYLLNRYLNKTLSKSEVYTESIGKLIVSLTAAQKELDRVFINEHIPFLEENNERNWEDSFLSLNSKIELIKTELEEAYKIFTKSLLDDLTFEFEAFKKDYRIVGTFELSKNKFSTNKVKQEIKAQDKLFVRSKEFRENFISAVFDRKEYYEDLLWFTFLILAESYKISSFGKTFLEEKINPLVSSIVLELNDSVNSLSNNDGNFKNLINQLKDNLSKSLDQNLIQKLINQIVSNNFSAAFTEYQKSIEQNLNEFEKEYTFVKPKELNYKLEQDELKTFSPKEIISPIVVNKINVNILKILSEFEGKVAKLNSSIIGLGRIIEYNLDSAQIKFSQEQSSASESITIAADGLLRAANKTEEFKKELEEYIKEVSVKLEQVIKGLIEDIILLSDIDRLITIRIQVSKEKALHEAKDNFYKSYRKLTVWYRWLKNKSTGLFFSSKDKIVGISSKVGLSDAETDLSEAMADYLVRVTESSEKLPYVYQRLFSNEQLTDERMFEGRKDEVEKLEKAISYWQNNQISSVMIIGEKGSGTSSLINIALKPHLKGLKVFRKEFGDTLYTEAELLKLLTNVMEFEEVDSVEQLISTINNLKEKRVVVIENIEDFFLRFVEGFDAITKLIEIITATNRKVFWITTCNLYAWAYLNKVLNIKDYFIFNIKLKELDENLLERIILSRHNISGYNLHFLPSPEIETQKSYLKMSAPEQHEYLQHFYFENLNDLTSNNIAVALFYWLRSILKIDDEQIEVSVELDFDFMFLKALSDQKLFTLMAITLHDGLSCEQHSKIFNMELKSSQLLFASLSDDGIIFQRGSNYKINFQLYTAIIKLLKDKNILH